jgi:LmbE family N-acetylglucosaminyl deacetylase
MKRARNLAAWALALIFVFPTGAEQRRQSGAAAVKQSIERLRVVASMLLIGAHPDDENTALLAWCAQGRKARAAYLSLTRGEGGQNLIGSEQGDLLGVIRTQELLGARRVDGAEQWFTRAIDFGFSKTADETLRFWGRDTILSDVVWVIRSYRPDVVVLRFSGTSRDGHGHHQASGILGREAFKLAADPKAFPEQLKFVQPWQAKRLVWNGFAFNRQQEQALDAEPGRFMVDTGVYDPVLGSSYGELAGVARSFHKSQGMGAAERRGSAPNYFFHYEGEPAKADLFDGVDTTWRRFPGGEKAGAALARASEAFRIDVPERVIPALMEARAVIAAIDHPDARRKLRDLDETVAMAAGLWADATAERQAAAPGSKIGLTLTLVNRGKAALSLEAARLEGLDGLPPVQGAPAALESNRPVTLSAQVTVPANTPPTQPFWLREPHGFATYKPSDQRDIGPAEGPAVLRAVYRLKTGGGFIEIERPVENRYVDRVRGELTRPFNVIPAVSLKVSDGAVLFPSAAAKPVPVEVRSTYGAVDGTLKLVLPPGWKSDPPEAPFRLANVGQVAPVTFNVTPPAAAARAEIKAVAQVNGQQITSALVRLDFDHIPPQVIQPPAAAPLVRQDVRLAARRIGYVMGAGDLVPQALEQMGAEVSLIDQAELSRGDLSRYDAIVTGVRAVNVREDLRANQARLRAYIENGGTLVVQYNILDGGAADPNAVNVLGPWPLRLSRDRVTVEDAPVKFLLPDHRLLVMPNRIAQSDFDGWVQERNLYVPGQYDPRYEAILECADPGEQPLRGGLLYTKAGKGTYVFTAYAFFRQLPAGVPGAFKLFANIVSAGK